MVSVEPSSRMSGRSVHSPAAHSASPTAAAKTNALLPMRSARSLSLPPRLRLMIDPQPMPMPKPKAWMMDISENTTPTAADALVESLETK